VKLEPRKINNFKKMQLLSRSIGLMTAFVLPIATFVLPGNTQSQKRPVYIVAHRCNTGSGAVNAVKRQGVNAIEADFMYYEEKWIVAHDHPSVGNPPKLDDWLTEVSKEASRSGSPLALLHVDIKTPDAPLDTLFTEIRKKLPNVNLIFDFGVVKGNENNFTKIKDKILNDNRAVAAMGFDDSPTDVNNFFKDQGYPLHKYWYEIGLAAGFVWSQQEQDWAREAIKLRNEGQGPKVVIWSFEKESSVNEWLKEGVDGILVNSRQCYGLASTGVSSVGVVGNPVIGAIGAIIEGLGADANVHVANAKKLTNTVYATPADDAFRIIRDQHYQVSIKTGNESGAGTDSNIFMTIYGTAGQTEETRLNGLISGDAFERNKTDTLTLKNLSDVGSLTKVTIRSDGSIAGSAWLLESVTINGRTAKFNRWVQKGTLTVEATF
jgi:hypothetical protein